MFTIPSDVCRLMNEETLQFNNALFADGRDKAYITIEKRFDAKGTPLSIQDKPIQSISMDEYKALRKEESCFIHYYDNAWHIECDEITKLDESAFGGGTKPSHLAIPKEYPFDAFEFHNHPLYREELPSQKDLITDTFEYITNDNYAKMINCVVGFDEHRNPRALCIKFNDKFIAILNEYKTKTGEASPA